MQGTTRDESRESPAPEVPTEPDFSDLLAPHHPRNGYLRTILNPTRSRSTSLSRSEAVSAEASRSQAPEFYSRASPPGWDSYSDPGERVAREAERVSIAGVSISPEQAELPMPFGDGPFQMGTEGLQDFNYYGEVDPITLFMTRQRSLSPPRRTRRKELFVDPLTSGAMDDTFFVMPSSTPLAGASRQTAFDAAGQQEFEPGTSSSFAAGSGATSSGLKRKRESSPDPEHPSSEQEGNIDNEITRMLLDQDADSIEQVGSSADRKGKGKAKEIDYKGKGKKREMTPWPDVIVIPDSPEAPTVKPSLKSTAPAKPAAEPLSSYTCPICFSPPTNATLTPCGHICCGICLFTAIKTTMTRSQLAGAADAAEARCPVCRASIPDWDGKGGGVIGLKARAIFSL